MQAPPLKRMSQLKPSLLIFIDFKYHDFLFTDDKTNLTIELKADFFGFLAPLAECYKYIERKLSVDNVIQLWLGIIIFNIAHSKPYFLTSKGLGTYLNFSKQFSPHPTQIFTKSKFT